MSENLKKQSLNSSNAEQTAYIGQRLAPFLMPSHVVLVIGDLGAGKTCLIQGICNGLGVNEPVLSPTFTLVKEYAGNFPVAHFDLYRLDDAESVMDIGLDEYMDSHICLIEWGNKFPEIIPDDAISVFIKIESEQRRVLEFINLDNLISD